MNCAVCFGSVFLGQKIIALDEKAQTRKHYKAFPSELQNKKGMCRSQPFKSFTSVSSFQGRSLSYACDDAGN